MDAEILCVGTEILLGNIQNTNARFLSEQLSLIGINIFRHTAVGDNPARLKSALGEALSRADLVITTGGLGPTCDDLTKEIVADLFGAPLKLHAPTLMSIAETFRQLGRELTENNKKQAYFPEGAHILQNRYGTAPGFALSKDGKTVLLLPGPPREMEPMFMEEAAPYLSRFSDGVIRSHDLHLFGIGESAAEAMLRDLMQSANPSLAPYAKTGEVLLRATAKAENSEKAESILRPLVDEVRRRVGRLCYGVDCCSLERRVLELLLDRGMRVALAESCTGGLTAKRLTDLPGASRALECAAVTYSNDSKTRLLGVPKSVIDRYGAVSRQVACLMARGARRIGKAHLGVGITGIAGPDGGTPGKPVGLVHIALCDGRVTWHKELRLASPGRDRAYIRHISTSHALDMLRRYLEKSEPV